MNKLYIIGLSALMGTAFVACDNYEEPNPQPQTNPQGIVLQAEDVVLGSTIVEGQTYSLEALNQENSNITVASFTAPDLGANYTYSAVVEMSADGFAKVAEVPCEVVAADGTYTIVITPDNMQGIYYASISKGPKAKDVQLRYKLYTESVGEKASQKARIGGEDNVYGPYTINITPFPATYIIEDAYYLVGTASDWEVSKAIKLNHSDLSPYDDPVFTYKFDVEEGWGWKIIPESVFVTGDWGTGANSAYGVSFDGDDSIAGALFAQTDTEEAYAGVLNVAGPYLLTINMEELTYSFDLAIDCLYTPGGSNGWNQTASQTLQTTDYSNYFGYAHLNGEYKFSSQPDWGGINYGAAAEAGKLSTDGGAGNLNEGADGLYYLKVNIASLTYSATNVATIGLIGDATPAGWDASTALTPSADFLTWTGDVHMKGAGEFKFRANDAWDINLGGDLNDLQQDGANIATPGEGDYTVTLNLGTYPYSATFVKK